MPEPSLAVTYLSMFTSVTRACEIEGDLIEQSHDRSKTWFAIQVVHTGLSLFRAAILNNGVSVILLSYATYELMTKAYLFGLRPLQNYLQYLYVPRAPILVPSMILLSLFVGGILLRSLPRIGMQVAFGVVAFFVLRIIVLQEGYSVLQAALYVGAPLLLSSLYFHRRAVERFCSVGTPA